MVNLAPLVGVVNLTSPVGVVVLAPPVREVNLASPVAVVSLAPPDGVVNLPSRAVGGQTTWSAQTVLYGERDTRMGRIISASRCRKLVCVCMCACVCVCESPTLGLGRGELGWGSIATLACCFKLCRAKMRVCMYVCVRVFVCVCVGGLNSQTPCFLDVPGPGSALWAEAVPRTVNKPPLRPVRPE